MSNSTRDAATQAPTWRVIYRSPIGPLELRGNAGALLSIDRVPKQGLASAPPAGLAKEAVFQLEQYFGNPGWAFTLPLEPAGTVFQKRVWQALRTIPAGQVRTYGAIAAQLGTSARAVGNACRANPLPVVVPCHRVLAVNGLGGYDGAVKGANLDVKRWLLAHEGVTLAL